MTEEDRRLIQYLCYVVERMGMGEYHDQKRDNLPTLAMLHDLMQKAGFIPGSPY